MANFRLGVGLGEPLGRHIPYSFSRSGGDMYILSKERYTWMRRDGEEGRGRRG